MTKLRQNGLKKHRGKGLIDIWVPFGPGTEQELRSSSILKNIGPENNEGASTKKMFSIQSAE